MSGPGDSFEDISLDDFIPSVDARIATAALKSVLKSLGTAPGFRECMRECALTLHQWTHADGASVYRLTPDQKNLQMIHTVGFPRRMNDLIYSIPVDASMAGRAVMKKELIYCPNISTAEWIPNATRLILQEHNFLASVAIPLMMHGQIVGAITLAWQREVRMNDLDRELLMHISYGIAIAVEHDIREFESTRDSLTGLMNRRELNVRLPAVHKVCNASETPLSMAVMDIDDFKQCNDKYGHVVGDDVLKTLTHYINSEMLLERGDGYRVGGEEFVLLLPDATARRAQSLVQRIAQGFAGHEFRSRAGRVFHVTFSAGIAQSNNDLDDNIDHLFVKADEAMYVAKASGKNRVVIDKASTPASEDPT